MFDKDEQDQLWYEETIRVETNPNVDHERIFEDSFRVHFEADSEDIEKLSVLHTILKDYYLSFLEIDKVFDNLKTYLDSLENSLEKEINSIKNEIKKIKDKKISCEKDTNKTDSKLELQIQALKNEIMGIKKHLLILLSYLIVNSRKTYTTDKKIKILKEGTYE